MVASCTKGGGIEKVKNGCKDDCTCVSPDKNCASVNII